MCPQKNSIPDRWGDYSNFKGVIKECHILPCKTPLKYTLFLHGVEDMLLTEDQHFTPSDFYEMVHKNLNLKLEFIIDFTNTSRYYNSDNFEKLGVKHVKIHCVGKCIPPEDVYKQFHMAMDTCIQRISSDGVIAVHCTHGLNRSGFLVCNYLMNKFGYSMEQAVDTFNTARGHDIERGEYLAKLRNDIYPAPTENTFEFQERIVDTIVTDSITAPIKDDDKRTKKRERTRSHQHRKRKLNSNPEPEYYPHSIHPYDYSYPPYHYPHHTDHYRDPYRDHYRDPYRDHYRDHTYHDGYHGSRDQYYSYEQKPSKSASSSSRYTKRSRDLHPAPFPKYEHPRTYHDPPIDRHHHLPPPCLPPEAWGPSENHPKGAFRIHERPSEQSSHKHHSKTNDVRTYSGVPYIKH